MANVNQGTERVMQGAGRLSDVLGRMAAASRVAVVGDGIRAAVVPIETTMKALCPIRKTKPSGRKALQPGEMRKSIKSKIVEYPQTGHVVGIIGPSGRAGRVAHLVEFGHLQVAPLKGRTIRKGTARDTKNGTTHVPPKPFIRPAILNTLGEQSQAFVAGATAGYMKALNQANS